MESDIFEKHEKLEAFPPLKLAYIVYRRFVEQGLKPTGMWLKDKISRRLQGFSPPEISEIAPGLFVGGQHSRRGVQGMTDAGIRAVVNMRDELDDATAGTAPEAYLWLPTIDDAAPTVEDLERGCAFIEEQIEAGSGVYVHCASGVGRAPTMAAAYLISLGMSAEEAWKTIRKGRPFIRPTPPQIAAISAFAERAAERLARDEEA